MTDALLKKNLIRRYLIWAYKSTKESFERIERKTTQLVVDEYLRKALKNAKGPAAPEYQKLITEFDGYIAHKKKEELAHQFADGQRNKFHPQYLYLKNRLKAIESAIISFLGAGELKKIEKLYEQEFIQRILQAKDH